MLNPDPDLPIELFTKAQYRYRTRRRAFIIIINEYPEAGPVFHKKDPFLFFS